MRDNHPHISPGPEHEVLDQSIKGHVEYLESVYASSATRERKILAMNIQNLRCLHDYRANHPHGQKTFLKFSI